MRQGVDPLLQVDSHVFMAVPSFYAEYDKGPLCVISMGPRVVNLALGDLVSF